MERSDIAKLLTLISLEFPRAEISRERVELWFDLIGHADAAIALDAVKLLLLELKFEPRVSDVATKIAELSTPAEERLDAGAAWELARSAISDAFWNKDSGAIKALPAPVRAAARAIGHYEIIHSDRQDSLRAAFIKFYEENKAAALVERRTPERYRGIGYTNHLRIER